MATFIDHMACRENKGFLKKMANDEVILFSSKLKLYKGWWYNSESILVITNHKFYEVVDGTIDKNIMLSNVMGLTYSTSNYIELIIHIDKDVDIQFENAKREEIFEVIKHIYFMIHNKNIPIYKVSGPLDLYVTTYKDVK